jgi:uncharacterized protein (TIGR03435 family)
MLATTLTNVVNRVVIDRTGMTGSFDYQLEWTPSAQTPVVLDSTDGSHLPDALPSVFTALREQLGLKLESGRALVEVLVIDHIDHPTEN